MTLMVNTQVFGVSMSTTLSSLRNKWTAIFWKYFETVALLNLKYIANHFQIFQLF